MPRSCVSLVVRHLVPLVMLACRREPTVDPDPVRFAGRDYAVLARPDSIELISSDDRRALRGARSDARHLEPCPRPRLIAETIDRDDVVDLVLYTCGWLELFLDHGAPLSRVDAIPAQRKEGHWVEPDPSAYPGLARLVPVLHEIDPALE